MIVCFQISAAKSVPKQESVEKDTSDSEKQDSQNALAFDELGGKFYQSNK